MIPSFTHFLAEVDPHDLVPVWAKTKVSHNEYIMVVGAIVAVTVAVLFWARFVRKRKRRTKYKYPHAEGKAGGKVSKRGQDKAGQSKLRRRSRRERRNPTLAETGGLPPVRNEWPDQEG
jgi:flagellar biosynthesis/type III secretory pathway M-ring protein FliF/YscJ